MKHWLNLHLILSLFFLPLLMAYAITGAMYMAGVDGQLGSNISSYTLQTAEKEPGDATLAELNSLGIELPEGEWRKGKNGANMLGSSVGRHIQLSVDKASGAMVASVVEPGLYPQMLLIHKGKAGLWFTILGYGAAASMLLLYVSGLAIVWRNKKKRPAMLAALVLGVAAVVAGMATL